MEPVAHYQYNMPQLTDEFLYQIIFCMEDQSADYCLDMNERQLVQVDFIRSRREIDPQRFIDIPPWGPSDGFHTMDKFVSSLRNPIYRERLKEVLQSGKGVFRQFKDVLKEQPALERLWYYFKDREMRNVIYLWYERNDESFRLSRLEIEPEEDASSLLLEDFSMSSDLSQYTKEIQRSFDEFVQSRKDAGTCSFRATELMLSHWKDVQPCNWNGFVVTTNIGSYAGVLLWTIVDDRTAEVLFFSIEPEFRGLGLFRFLFDHMTRKLSRIGITDICISLVGEGLKVSSMFDLVVPTLESQYVSIKTRRWNEGNESSDLAYL